MDTNSFDMADHLAGQGATPSREVRRHRRKPARSGEATVKPGLIQVSVQVPRDVMASFDEFSAASGVNRQHLVREALAAYAALLEGGCRVYQVPGVMLSRDRAA